MKEPWGTVIAFASVIAVTFALTWLWRDSVWRADLAAALKDTTSQIANHETPPYSVSGTVPATSPRPSETGKPRPVAPLPLIVPPVTNSSADSLNCEHTILLNTIGSLQARLYELENDTQEFREDSLRYSLMVLYDPKKNINERWWRWLQIKPYPYSDTSSTITQTVVQPGPRDWIPWAISGVAVVLLILSMLYG